MTKSYKAGEHVKVIKSDPGYNEELGDQTGLVGTVLESNVYGGAYVVFPHTGDQKFYYYKHEIEPAVKQATAPTPEPAFKAGEYVKIVGNRYGSSYANRPLKVRADAAAGSTYVELDMTYSASDTKSWRGTVQASEVVKTDAPEPVKEYLFREGDHVRFVEGHNPDWTGAEFTVRKDVEQGKPSLWGNYELAQLTVTKPARSGCRVGEETQVGAHKLEKFTPAPEPKFKVGDWVQVKGYSDHSSWEGFIGKVTLFDSDLGTYVIDNGKGEAYSKGGFSEKYLVAAEKPATHKFKVGDWVEVTGWSTNFDGRVYQVKELPKDKGGCYVLKSKDGTDGFSDTYLMAAEKPYEPKFKVGDWVEAVNWSTDWDGTPAEVLSVPTGKGGYYQIKLGAASGLLVKGHTGGFSERYLKASQKPAEPHWTEAKPVGTATRIGARTLVKVEEDKWLFVYHDGREDVASTRFRNNDSTKGLFGYEEPKFSNVPN